MGKLITVVGNSGVGKTTFIKRFCEAGSFTPILEVTHERPFLQKFKHDLKGFCFANQMDFLLYQAEMQLFIQENDLVGVQDGGLGQSFHVFTKRFYQKGYLDDGEYRLCERLYSMMRRLLPSPDMRLVLSAPRSVVAERMRRRGRVIDIERDKDLEALDELFAAWLQEESSIPTIKIDASKDDPSYAYLMQDLLSKVRSELRLANG